MLVLFNQQIIYPFQPPRLALLTLWILPDTWSRPYPPRLYGLLALLFSIECKLPPVWSIGVKYFYVLFHGHVGIRVPLIGASSLCVVLCSYINLLGQAVSHSCSSTLYQAGNFVYQFYLFLHLFIYLFFYLFIYVLVVTRDPQSFLYFNLHVLVLGIWSFSLQLYQQS